MLPLLAAFALAAPPGPDPATLDEAVFYLRDVAEDVQSGEVDWREISEAPPVSVTVGPSAELLLEGPEVADLCTFTSRPDGEAWVLELRCEERDRTARWIWGPDNTARVEGLIGGAAALVRLDRSVDDLLRELMLAYEREHRAALAGTWVGPGPHCLVLPADGEALLDGQPAQVDVFPGERPRIQLTTAASDLGLVQRDGVLAEEGGSLVLERAEGSCAGRPLP